jgi:hypothetical protein
MTRSTSARIAGVGYLVYMAAGICNEILMQRATSAEGTAAILARIGEHATDVRLSVLLKLGECFSALVLAVTLFAITRDEDHELAVLGLVCRVAEGIFVASLIPSDLGLLWLSRGAQGAMDVASTNALGALLLRPEGPLGAVFFAVGSAIFSYLLLRGRMIPVFLAWLGVLSSALLVVGLPLQLSGFLTGPLTAYQWAPATLFAPALGLWLLIKGVAPVERRVLT